MLASSIAAWRVGLRTGGSKISVPAACTTNRVFFRLGLSQLLPTVCLPADDLHVRYMGGGPRNKYPRRFYLKVKQRKEKEKLLRRKKRLATLTLDRLYHGDALDDDDNHQYAHQRGRSPRRKAPLAPKSGFERGRAKARTPNMMAREAEHGIPNSQYSRQRKYPHKNADLSLILPKAQFQRQRPESKRHAMMREKQHDHPPDTRRHSDNTADPSHIPQKGNLHCRGSVIPSTEPESEDDALDQFLQDIMPSGSKTITEAVSKQRPWISMKRDGATAASTSTENTVQEIDTPNQQQFRREHAKPKDLQRRASTAAPTHVREAAGPFPPDKLDVFVACLPGLEPFLADELKSLGISFKEVPGGAELVAKSVEDLMTLHLYLGTASHVMLRCGLPFAARGFPELQRKVAALPWGRILNDGSELNIRVTSKKSKLLHTTAIRNCVEEGIRLSLQRQCGRPAKSPKREGEEDDRVRLLVRMEHDHVQLSIDTSATPLHRRGYRLETAKAPLREDLAFAMVYSAGWRKDDVESKEAENSRYRALWDPFCGSGTIAIEAAGLVHGLPPGRLRSAPLYGTALYSPGRWRRRVKAAIKDANSETEKVLVAASDRDAGAIEAAKSNAERAGLKGSIDFHQLSISVESFENVDRFPLLIATNPPFGMRIQQKTRKNSKVPEVYYRLADSTHNLSNSKRGVGLIALFQDPNVFRRTGMKLDVKFSSQHGGIPVAAVFSDGTKILV